MPKVSACVFILMIEMLVENVGTFRVSTNSLLAGAVRPRTRTFCNQCYVHSSLSRNMFFVPVASQYFQRSNSWILEKVSQRKKFTKLYASYNRFSRNQHSLPSTKEDLDIFRGILQKVGSLKPEEIPSVIGSHVDFLLTRNIAELARQTKQSCMTPSEGADLDNQLETVLNFLEEFVAMAQSMATDNKNLLREILQAANAGMEAFDSKIQNIVSGDDPRYTPEFVRYLSSEISRLNQTVSAEQERTPAVPQSAEGEDEEGQDEEDASPLPNAVEPDARTTMMVLSMIRVRQPPPPPLLCRSQAARSDSDSQAHTAPLRLGLSNSSSERETRTLVRPSPRTQPLSPPAARPGLAKLRLRESAAGVVLCSFGHTPPLAAARFRPAAGSAARRVTLSGGGAAGLGGRGKGRRG